MKLRNVMIGLVNTALLTFLAALVLQDASAIVWRHVLFAMGIMPLILGAMLYFIPVLTRTPPAKAVMLWVPVGAFLLGVSAVIGFMAVPNLVTLSAGMTLILVALEFVWAWRRRAQVLGGIHPGVDWYLAALAALMFALGLIVSRIIWPEGWVSIRMLHLHLNLFGFIGLTAIGTLRVLLPTVLAKQDPSTMAFLRRQLPVALAGTLAIAMGAAFWPPLSLLGAMLWIWPSLFMLRSLRQDKQTWSALRGAGVALAGAALGWWLVLCAGMAHGLGLIDADTVLAWLLYLFLLPLVTGASSYLLPIWRWPGRQSLAHALMRERLMASSGIRVMAFVLSAVLVAVDIPFAPLPAALALLSYLVQMLFAFLHVQQTSIG